MIGFLFAVEMSISVLLPDELHVKFSMQTLSPNLRVPRATYRVDPVLPNVSLYNLMYDVKTTVCTVLLLYLQIWQHLQERLSGWLHRRKWKFQDLAAGKIRASDAQIC